MGSLKKRIAVLTTMNNSMNIIKIRKALEYSQSNFPYDVDVYRSNLLVNAIEGTLIHEFHADTDIWIGDESAIERDDILRITVMHDL